MRKVWLLALLLAVVAPVEAKPKTTPIPPLVKRVVNAVMAGDPKPIKNDMTPQMAQALSRDVMQKVKKQVIEPLGVLRFVTIASSQKVQGFTVTIATLHLEKGDATAQIAQDGAGKVAGLFVRPGNK